MLRVEVAPPDPDAEVDGEVSAEVLPDDDDDDDDSGDDDDAFTSSHLSP